MKEEAGISPGPSSPPGAPVPELRWAPRAIHNHQPWHTGSPLGEEGTVPLTAPLTDGLRLTREGTGPLAGLREQQGVCGGSIWGQAQSSGREVAPPRQCTAQRWPRGRGWAAGTAPTRGTTGRTPSASPLALRRGSLCLCAPGPLGIKDEGPGLSGQVSPLLP